MLLADTASLMHKIEAENVYENFCKDKELFEFSNYPKDSEFYNNSKNLVVCKMKNETCGLPIKRFYRIKISNV